MAISLRRRWQLGRPPLDTPFELNRDSPQAQGLVTWWPTLGSRGANLLQDFGGHGLDGAFKGAGEPGWEVDGTVGSVVKFDGGDDFIQSNRNVGISGAAPWTLATWAKFGPATIEWANLMSIGLAGVPLELVVVTRGSLDTNLNLNLWGPDNVTAIACGLDFTVAIAQVIAAYDGTDIKVYVNGNLKATKVVTLSITDNPLRIGGQPGGYGGHYYDGFSGDSRCYNRALSAVEAWQLWDPATRWGLYRPLRRWWAVKWPWVISECRQYKVPLDRRTSKVPVESRVATILRETRTIKVPCGGG